MCDWKHWLIVSERMRRKKKKKRAEEWDYYDEEYCLRKLGIVNRERDDIGF